MNKSLTRLLNKSRKELIGREVNDILMNRPDQIVGEKSRKIEKYRNVWDP